MEKDEIRKSYMNAAAQVRRGVYSCRRAALVYEVNKSTLNRLVNNKIDITRIGNIGRTSLLSSAQERIFLQAISTCSTRGNWVSKADLGMLALETSNTTHSTQRIQPPSERYYFHLKKKHSDLGLTKKKIADRSDDKLLSLDKSIFQSFFQDIKTTYEKFDYQDIREDCGLGMPAIPSNAVYCCDEISLSMYKDTDQFSICLKHDKPAGNLAGGLAFHVTLMVTINLSGFVLPPFLIVSNNYPLQQDISNVFIGLGPNGTVCSNENGSMQSSIGVEGDNNYSKGSFRSFCDFLVSTAHVYSALPRDKNILVFADNHGSRNDVSALEVLQKNNICLKTIPRNSSFILQAGDTSFVNKKLQDARRSIISNLRKLGVKITPESVIRSVPAIISKVMNTDIYLAAEAVGFHFDDNYKRLVMSNSCISSSIAKFDNQYLFDDNKKQKLVEEKNKIFNDVQRLKEQGVIPSNIDSSVCNPKFISCIQKIAEGQTKQAIRDIIPPIIESRRRTNHTFDTLTSEGYISQRKNNISEKNIKRKQVETKNRLRKVLHQELSKINVKLGPGRGGNIKSNTGFLKRYYDEEISVHEAIHQICNIRGIEMNIFDDSHNDIII